jgi:hypothetical protein
VFDGCTASSKTPLPITSNLSIVPTIVVTPSLTVLDKIINEKFFGIKTGAVLLDLSCSTLEVSEAPPS